MLWDTVHTESQVPFFAALSTQILTCIGMLLFDKGKSVWLKTSVGLFSAFIFNFVTKPIWLKFSFIRISSVKDQLPSKALKNLFIPQKSKSFLRLILGALFTSLTIVSFLYSRGTSAIVNSIVYIFMKLFVSIAMGNVKATKTGRLISCVTIGSSCLIIAISTKMKLYHLIQSFAYHWLSTSYVKYLVPAFHSEPAVIPPILLFSSLFSFIFGIIFEGFNFRFNLLKTVLAGCFLWATPNFFILMKKSLSENSVLSCFSLLPFATIFLLHFTVFENSQLPLSLYMAVILTFIGSHFITFSIPEINVFRPFSTTQSTIHTILSIFLVFSAFTQYFVSQISSQLWRFADSLHLLINLNWSLSEIFYLMQRKSSEQFSYGYGRLSSIFSFCVSIFALFSTICILTQLFSNKKIHDNTSSIFYNFPSLISHTTLIFFYILTPRNSQASRSQSIRNAVNISSASDIIEKKKEDSKINPTEILSFILCIFGSFIQKIISNNYIILFDRILVILFLVIIVYLIVPVLRASISQLMQSTPTHIESCYSIIRTELSQCPCVTDITYLNFWQNDEALTVATIRVKIDEKLCPKLQEFLMLIISMCQQEGILDVTAEIVGKNEEVLFAFSHSPFRRNSAIV